MPDIAAHIISLSNLDPDQANDITSIKQLLTSVISALDYTCLNIAEHQFSPQGVTAVALLAESHLSIHTWPEEKHAVMELLSCRPLTKQQEQQMKALVAEHFSNAKIKVKKVKVEK